MFCIRGERAPPPGLTGSLIMTPFIWQVMVTNVTSLLKTVKAVEDEATRGTRALEATIECIKQELTVRAPHSPKPLLYSLLGVNWWDSLSAKLVQRGSGISMSIILNKTVFFCSFSFIICPAPFLLLLSQPLQVSHSSYQGLGSRRRQSEKGRGRKLVFCNLPLILIRGPPARKEALPRAAAKAKFNTVYLTPNYTATSIKKSCPSHLIVVELWCRCNWWEKSSHHHTTRICTLTLFMATAIDKQMETNGCPDHKEMYI